MHALLQGKASSWGWPAPVELGRLWHVVEGPAVLAEVVVAKAARALGRAEPRWWTCWCSACPGDSSCAHARLCAIPAYDLPLDMPGEAGRRLREQHDADVKAADALT